MARMTRNLQPVFGLVAFVVVLLALCFIGRLVISPTGKWLVVPRPPVLPHATHVEVLYPSNDLERIIGFDTEQSATGIQQFYRGELPKHGWQYRCTVALPAGMNIGGVDTGVMDNVQPTPSPTQAPSQVAPLLDVGTDVMDVYERSASRIRREQTLEVVIFEQGTSEAAGTTTMVRLNEWSVRLPELHHPCTAR